jgi:Transcriptional antiterminator
MKNKTDYLSIRQMATLDVLEEMKGKYVSKKTISKLINSSERTIQNDIQVLKEVLSRNGGLIEAKIGYGYRLTVSDSLEVNELKQRSIRQYSEIAHIDYPQGRSRYIISRLLWSKEGISSNNLVDELFVSKSSFSSDLKRARQILKKYNLSIVRESNKGIIISGLEKNKRACIVMENMINDFSEIQFSVNMEYVSTVIVDKMTFYQYSITDLVLQNLVVHICTSIERMRDGEFIRDSIELEDFDFEKEIAAAIISELAVTYNLPIVENEINYLAMQIQSKRKYDIKDAISDEINKYVREILELIGNRFGFDFSNDVELILAISLHLKPLFVRMKNNVRLYNSKSEEIQNSIPLAFDMATNISHWMSRKFGFVLNNSEISYIALHLGVALEKKENQRNQKKVLVITCERRGGYLLLQQRLYHNLHPYLEKLTIVDNLTIEQEIIDEYDIVLTTEKNVIIHPHVINIDYFISDDNLLYIRKCLMKNNSKYHEYFNERTTFIGNVDNKIDIIFELCEMINKEYEIDENLFDAVLRRENLGYTGYSNNIALTHPDNILSLKTVVGLGLLENAIEWEQGIFVKIVILVCVQEDREDEIKDLFNCFSELIKQKELVDQIIAERTLENFINVISSVTYSNLL